MPRILRPDQGPKTFLYLVRHGATEANLAQPARLQGRRHDAPLAPLGIRQAEATRDFLAIRPIDHCYCSPLLRAVQTAEIVAAPHRLEVEPVDALTECDIGDWEGLDWPTIREADTEAYRSFLARPGEFGYPGGESLRDVQDRAAPIMESLFARHPGEALLVVGHHIVNRTYLAALLGLSVNQARQVMLDHCGISVLVREGDTTTVNTLNAAFHLQGVAA
jgi:broad specificity phosphatase PhoE